MSVFELNEPEVKKKKPDVVCPNKIIVLALARDHRGIRAKMLAETLHSRFPDDYHKPLVKFFHDIGWRDTLNRLRKASKKWDYVAPVIVFVNKKLVGDDDDFNLYIRQTHFLLAEPKKIQAFKNMTLLDQLQMDPLKTYVYFDISIDYRPCGRMIFQIEGDTMPKSTKGFLHLCCSQKIPLPPGQYKRSKFAGSLIRRIVKGGWVRIDTTDDDRLYAKGKYEKPVLKHDRRGILSMNLGPRGCLSSHLVISLDQHPWMDKLYRAIGVLIDGEHVLHMLENVDTTYENPDIDVVITDNGILHSPNMMTTEGFLNPEIRAASEKLQAFKDEYKSVLAAYIQTKQCLEPADKPQPKEEDDIKVETVEWTPSDPHEEVIDLYGIPVPSSLEDTLLKSKSRVSGYTTSQSKLAVWGSEGRSREVEKNLPSDREIGSLAPSQTLSFGSSKMLGDSAPSIHAVKSGTPLSSKIASKKMSSAVQSVPSEKEYLGEELGEDVEIKPALSEPDIQYTYVVPKGMVDMRVGYKTFADGKRPEQFQKVGIKLPRKAGIEGSAQGTAKSPGKKPTSHEEPYQKIEKDGDTDYYEFSQKAMIQVTPKVLLTWAQGIEDDAELAEIEQTVKELLETAIPGEPSDVDLEGHALDAISMVDTRERFHKCLLSLPPQLLQMLHQSMLEIFESQDDGTVPLVVTGDSTSKMKLLEPMAKKTKALSEDVISGIMFSLIDFTKRMIESSTELIPNRRNLDFVTSLIDDVILQKVHAFIDKKKKKDARFKKKFQFKFFPPGDQNKPYMKDLRKTKSGISYYLDADLLPTGSASAASLPHFSEISAKHLPVHIKDPPKKTPSSA